MATADEQVKAGEIAAADWADDDDEGPVAGETGGDLEGSKGDPVTGSAGTETGPARVQTEDAPKADATDWADSDDDDDGAQEQTDSGPIEAPMPVPAPAGGDWADSDDEDEDEGASGPTEALVPVSAPPAGGDWADSDDDDVDEGAKEPTASSPSAEVPASAPPATDDWADSDEDNEDVVGGREFSAPLAKAESDAQDELKEAAPVKATETESGPSEALSQGPPYTVYLSNFPPTPPSQLHRDMENLLSETKQRGILFTKDKEKGTATGAYVEITDADSLRKCFALDNTTFNGAPLRVQMAENPPPTWSNRRGDSGRYGGQSSSQRRDPHRREWAGNDQSSGPQRHGTQGRQDRAPGRSWSGRDNPRGSGPRRGFSAGSTDSGRWGSGRSSSYKKAGAQVPGSDEFVRVSSNRSAPTNPKIQTKNPAKESVTTKNAFAALMPDDDE